MIHITLRIGDVEWRYDGPRELFGDWILAILDMIANDPLSLSYLAPRITSVYTTPNAT